MDAIFKKLSEIEEAAGRMADRTTEQKNQMLEAMRERTEAYDRQLNEKTEEEIKSLKEALQRQREEELKKLREEADQQMKALDDYYEKNHRELAQKILARILEV